MSKKLIRVKACVRSGLCCKKAPCPFGEWDENLSQCVQLLVDNDGIHSCAKYEEILTDPSATFAPAFGYGCCMTIGNQSRNEIIEKFYGGEEPTILIENFY